MLDHLERIPRELLYVGLDDLAELGVPQRARDALRALLADLPLVPDAASSAQLIGPPDSTLPCLAVLARHVVQGLRDYNLSLAHDRPRLRAERRKLLFFDHQGLADALERGDERPLRESVLCIAEASERDVELVRARELAGLASFITSAVGIDQVPNWRKVGC